MNFALDIAPLAGFLVGINYWNTFMDDDYKDPKYHSVQFCFGVFALILTWHTTREE